MARLVFAAALSHGPLLATTPQQWTLRANADRASKKLWFRGEEMDYATLLERRRDDVDTFRTAASDTERTRRHQRCQVALDHLAARFAEARVDLAVVVGNDQRELLADQLRPALLVIGADQIANVPLTEEARSALPPGVAEAEDGHCPPDGAQYSGSPLAARAIVEGLITSEVDVGWSNALPTGGKQVGIPHAFGFVYRRVMRDAPPPSIPIVLNAVVEPNRPTSTRCFAYGNALLRAIDKIDPSVRVGLIASGGLSHFVVDEALDDVVMSAVRTGDLAMWKQLDDSRYEGNTGEIKNWMPVVEAATASGLHLDQADYVACYRTEAGTGSGMGFVTWK
jgi:hypothetical protein